MVRHPTKSFNTLSGMISVATPETLSIALVNAIGHAGGIDNVATILSELADQIDPKYLAKRIALGCPISSLQRLGYLVELLCRKDLADVILHAIQAKETHWVKLSPSRIYTPVERNKTWKVIANTKVEMDV